MKGTFIAEAEAEKERKKFIFFLFFHHYSYLYQRRVGRRKKFELKRGGRGRKTIPKKKLSLPTTTVAEHRLRKKRERKLYRLEIIMKISL